MKLDSGGWEEISHITLPHLLRPMGKMGRAKSPWLFFSQTYEFWFDSFKRFQRHRATTDPAVFLINMTLYLLSVRASRDLDVLPPLIILFHHWSHFSFSSPFFFSTPFYGLSLPFLAQWEWQSSCQPSTLGLSQMLTHVCYITRLPKETTGSPASLLNTLSPQKD